MCPVSTVGNPGIAMSQQCVDCTFAPSGRLIESGFVAILLLLTGIPSMMNIAVAPVSRINFELRSNFDALSRSERVAFAMGGSDVGETFDLFDMTTVTSSLSVVAEAALIIWVGIREHTNARFNLSATCNFSAPTCQNPPGGGS